MHILANDFEENIPTNNKNNQGGLARFTSQLAKYLNKNKHKYTGIIIKNDDTNISHSESIYKKLNTQYIGITIPRKLTKGLTTTKEKIDLQIRFKVVIDCIYHQLLVLKPDIVLVNGAYLNPLLLLIAAKKACIPSVIIHGGILHKELDAYSKLFSHSYIKTLKDFEKRIPEYASKQVFLNKYSEKTYQKEVVKSPKSKRIIIPLPTPFKQVKKKPAKKHEKINVGIVARWDRIKNHKAVLALAEEIDRQGLEIQIHAITTIPETKKHLEYKNRYKKLINVHPHTDAEGILKFFRAMDIAILPSHFETAGFVVLEAASQGVGTIISPYVGWIDDYRETGNRKWVGDFTKPKSVVKSIQNLATKHLSNELLVRFQKDHEPSTVFSKYLKLFKSLT